MPIDPITSGGAYAGNGGFYLATNDTGMTSASTGVIRIITYQTSMASTAGITGLTWGVTTTGFGFGESGANAWPSNGQPNWEPVQAAALRKDYEALKTSWKRKRAEIRARRLFRRIVGEIAWLKFDQRGYHEIYGASRTRYRLRPGFRVQVMKGCADEVDYELCAHLEIGIPWHDSMGVQHLMLTASKETEEKFRLAANTHPAHGPYPIEELTKAA